MSKRRILFAIAGLCPGGGERQMSLLCKHIDREHYDVGMLIFTSADKVFYKTVFAEDTWFRALNLSKKGQSKVSLAIKLISGIAKAIDEFKPDIIHTSLNVANVMTRITGLLWYRSIPIITSIRCNFMHYSLLDRIVERCLSYYSAAIIVNSKSTLNQLGNLRFFNKKNLLLIENAVDPEFLSSSMPDAIEQWPKSERVALMIGRLSEEKNHLPIIKALKKLEMSGETKAWRFVLVGQGHLHNEIQSVGLNNLSILPVTQNTLACYKHSTILILPSLSEGMPNVALEAQACGLPVAYSRGANQSGVMNRERGWELDEHFSNSLKQILNSEDKEIRKKGMLSKAYILEHFTVKKLTRLNEALYENILR